MADFCRQCYRELFDDDRSDLTGLTQEQFDQGMCKIGICEGCGGGEFGVEGECLGCDEHEYVQPVLDSKEDQ